MASAMKRRRLSDDLTDEDEEDVDGEDEDEDEEEEDVDGEDEDEEEEDVDEEEDGEEEGGPGDGDQRAETPVEKRVRLAKEYLQRVKDGLRAGRRLDRPEGDGDDRARRRGTDADPEDGEDADPEDGEDGDEEDGDDEMLGDALKREVLRDEWRQHRRLASSIRTSAAGGGASTSAPAVEVSSARLLRGAHRLPLTALAVSEDGRRAFSASKDNRLVQWDVETGAREAVTFPVDADADARAGRRNLSNVATGTIRVGNDRTLMSLAASSDGRYLAAGGTGRAVHVWDLRAGGQARHLGAMPGHRACITSCAFREGTAELFTGSADRTIKIWNLAEMAYVDTLYGHGAEVLGVDVGRRERVLSCGRDRTCRIWKVPEETQLVYQAGATGIESCALLTPTQWVTGGDDGSISLWSQLKKKATSRVAGAHARRPDDLGGQASCWVGAVAACRNSDLVASGAGDGRVRFWCAHGAVEGGGGSSFRGLRHLGDLPARGFVNGLHLRDGGALVVAGVGQEQRWGRWARIKSATNGVALTRLRLDG